MSPFAVLNAIASANICLVLVGLSALIGASFGAGFLLGFRKGATLWRCGREHVLARDLEGEDGKG